MKNTTISLFLLCYIFIGLLSCKLNEEASPNAFADFKDGLFVRNLDTMQLEILNKGWKEFPNVSIIKILDDSTAISIYERINTDSTKQEVHRIQELLKKDPGYIKELTQKGRSYDLTYHTINDSVYFVQDLKYAQVELYGRLINNSIELTPRISSSTNMYDPDNKNVQLQQYKYYH